MSLESDLKINSAKLGSGDDETQRVNQAIRDMYRTQSRWYEIGAAKFREMRWKGEAGFPKPTVLDETASTLEIPSRDPGRSIPCRVMRPSPSSSSTPCRGLFVHIHGGGWVLNSNRYFDPYLKKLADDHHLIVVSIGYRLAPENPFPAGPHDCYDVVEWLIDNGTKEFGADAGVVKFIGGESAGGNLSALVTLHLLQHENERYRSFKLQGLVLHYGSYDLSWPPSAKHFDQEPPLVLNIKVMEEFLNAYLPGWSLEDRKKPEVSPLHVNLKGLALPPALFTCGTEDSLLDDTVFMGAKWAMNGAETVVRFYPGAAHGFTMMTGLKVAQECLTDVKAFIDAKLR